MGRRGRGAGPAALPAFPQASEAEAAGRFVLRPPVLFRRRAGPLGFHRRRGRRRLLRLAIAADRPARRSEAAAEHRHSGERRLASRQPGRDGRRDREIKELPPYLPKAFVAIEDRRFYDHFGVDPMGIARAAVRNLSSRGVSQGGSTLTQQLAKNLFLTQERTASRKIQEAILALWLERKYTKDEILELYLNRVYFGSGAYGIEAAAQRYYGKSARNVSLSEAAVLAGLVQAPSRLAPNRNPEAAQTRAELVIAAMNDLGFITRRMTKTALGAPAEPVEAAGRVGQLRRRLRDGRARRFRRHGRERHRRRRPPSIPRCRPPPRRSLVDELDAKGQKFNVSQGACRRHEAGRRRPGPGRRAQL